MHLLPPYFLFFVCWKKNNKKIENLKRWGSLFTWCGSPCPQPMNLSTVEAWWGRYSLTCISYFLAFFACNFSWPKVDTYSQGFAGDRGERCCAWEDRPCCCHQPWQGHKRGTPKNMIQSMPAKTSQKSTSICTKKKRSIDDVVMSKLMKE